MAQKNAKKKTVGKKPLPQKKAAPRTPQASRSGKGQDQGGAKSLNNEIQGILLIACGFFLLLAFLTETAGAVGGFLKDLFYGLLGSASAVSCIFVILTGVQVFRNREGRRNVTRGLLLLGLVLGASVLVALAAETNEAGNSFVEEIVLLWQDGVKGHGGGVFGGGICRILTALIGVAGAWILAMAAELILCILLTGISVGALWQKCVEIFRRKRENRREESADREKTERRGFFGGREPKAIEEPTVKQRKSGFFEGYFSGEEPLPEPNSDWEEEGPKEEGQTAAWRFELREDDPLFQDDVPAEIQEALPFRLDNMKTGTLSELPLTEADGRVIPKENPEEEDPVFTPPSEAKLEDVAEPSTQKAMEAGVSLDRAVVAGRRMMTDTAGEGQTQEKEIEDQLSESAAALPRMMEYFMPTSDLLDPPKPRERSRQEIRAELEEKANRLLDTLHSFKVEAKIINITQGPAVTRFELQPGVGVKVSKFTGLTDDIALSLAAPGIRIEAPIPGKSAIGIEIPNKEATPVPIREVLESEKFQNFPSKTAFALGKDIAGSCVIADIAKFPHVLIAGQTGSGKSVCINSLILSILFKARPDEVKLIMVDPKMVELGIYNGIPHLLIPVVTDPKHAAGALNWAVIEMQNRYNLLKDNNVRNLKGYNALMEERGEPESKLPEIVIIIDEFADLMIAAKNEVENAIQRLAALARAAGMYLVIATQRPTVNVITGVIKANIPSRIAFNVTAQVDSRTILDENGAEKLLGRGDMLYNPSGAMKPMRIQGNFVSDAEIERVITFIKGQYEACYDEGIIENIQREQERVSASLENHSQREEEEPASHGGGDARDELFFQAVEMVLDNGQASVAMFQRRFKIGYQRAARLIDQMEERRIIGPYEGTKPRQVLISRQEFLEMRMHETGE